VVAAKAGNEGKNWGVRSLNCGKKRGGRTGSLDTNGRREKAKPKPQECFQLSRAARRVADPQKNKKGKGTRGKPEGEKGGFAALKENDVRGRK